MCVPLTISGGKSQLEKLGPIIGGALGGFTVAALITACFLATIVRRQRIRNKGTMTIMELQSNQRSGDQAALTHFQHTELADAIETSRNEAYGTSIATPCHEAYNTSTVAIITSQNEAYGTSIATPCNEAYNTSTVAIITSQNEAYGSLQPGGRDSRSDDYGYVINQLNYEEVGARLSAQYDYVQVDSPDQSGKYTHE